MVFYLTLMAVANIGLGFGFAVYLGRRYRALTAAACWADLPMGLAPSLPGMTAANPTVEPSLTATPSQAATNGQKSERQAAGDGLHELLDRFAAQLGDMDGQLRQHARDADATQIEACLGTIETTVREYLQNRQGALERLAEQMRGDPQWDEFHNDLEVGAKLQDAQVKATRQAVAKFSYESDLGGGCLQLAAKIHRLADSNDRLRDSLDRAMVWLARKESRLGAPDESRQRDPLTGCLNREGIEATLATLWDSDPERDGRLCVALLDVDRLGRVNEQYGYRAGSEILRNIAQQLQVRPQDNITVARFAGQQFMVVFCDVSLEDVIATIERTRQTIERAHFDHQDSDIRLTLSCAISTAIAHDQPTAVVQRVQAALQEAKRYGHNHTFVHEGRFPSPVEPPELSVDEIRIAI